MIDHSCAFHRPDFECPTCGLYVMEYLEGLKDRCETWGAERDKLKAQLDIAMVALNHYAEPNGLSEEFLARTAITKIKEIK